MWSKMQTSYFSSSMCLVVGRSEIYTLIKTFKRELCWEVLSKQVHYCYPLTCSMKKICTVSCFAVVVIFCSNFKIPYYRWPLGIPWIYFSKLDWQDVETWESRFSLSIMIMWLCSSIEVTEIPNWDHCWVQLQSLVVQLNFIFLESSGIFIVSFLSSSSWDPVLGEDFFT